eukprot:GHRR01029506.1.p1 GENE.GHRR01029506.1~~GHRR01029506.1.p1  ORF type:complete len:136 (+),score=25.16 GHRR01029506.1:94-501(+)
MLSGRLAPWLGVLGLGAGGGILLNSADSNGSSNDVQLLATVPTRQQQVAHLSSSRPNQPFELLVIGGGATGCGIAVDAATRWAALQHIRKYWGCLLGPQLHQPRHRTSRQISLQDWAKCSKGALEIDRLEADKSR